MTVFNRVIDRVASDETYLEETLAAAARCATAGVAVQLKCGAVHAACFYFPPLSLT